MSRGAFAAVAFTPAVKKAQEQRQSPTSYRKWAELSAEPEPMPDSVKQFALERDGFYLGSVSETGWPYIQFRGGPPGFLQPLDDRTLAFADFRGNRQYLSVANIENEPRVFLFLMDYAHRRRLKIWGRARVVEGDPELLGQLTPIDYEATLERAILIEVEAWDWNCPQHIPQRFTAAEWQALSNEGT